MRYHDRAVGFVWPTPGQTTAPAPQLTTTVFGGTPNVFQPLGSFPSAAASLTASLSSSLSRSVTGPATSFLFSSNRYQFVSVPSLTSAC
jgi:hypothetical protein